MAIGEEFLDLLRDEEARTREEQYERDIIRRAPALFAGGNGGSTHERVIRTRLSELVAPFLGKEVLPPEEDPFLADLVWWKAGDIAVVEASIQVDAEDIQRAWRRSATIGKTGA